MAGDYYPDYYLKKRQKDQTYRKIGWIAGAIVMIVLGVVGAIWLLGFVPQRKVSGGLVAEAERLEQLENAQDTESAASLDQNPDSNDTDQQGSEMIAGIDPRSQEYTTGLANVESRLEGIGDGASVAHDMEQDSPTTDPNDSNDPHQIPEAGQEQPDETAQEQPDEPTETEPEPEKPKPEPKPDPVKPDPAKPEAMRYLVGAGAYLDRQEAESRMKDLAAFSLTGHIEEQSGEFQLIIDKIFDDYEQSNALVQKLRSQGFSGAFQARTSR